MTPHPTTPTGELQSSLHTPLPPAPGAVSLSRRRFFIHFFLVKFFRLINIRLSSFPRCGATNLTRLEQADLFSPWFTQIWIYDPIFGQIRLQIETIARLPG